MSLLKICTATQQTVFMITHDVDEAILLSNKIMLMSNGPRARIAEIVVNTLPASRQRETMHHDPQFLSNPQLPGRLSGAAFERTEYSPTATGPIPGAWPPPQRGSFIPGSMTAQPRRPRSRGLPDPISRRLA